MKTYQILTLILAAAFLWNCDADDFEEFPSDAVTYTVSFNLDWNSTDFPTDYPSNAHFSDLIGWSHLSVSTFFEPGTKATDGIKNMAETGKTSPLDEELKNRIISGEGLDRVIGSNLSNGVGTITVDVVVHKDHPAVTFATMLAPSPDWYAAAVNVLLFENNDYVNQKTVDLKVYDAGTDSGVTFTSANVETSPQENITVFNESPIGDGTSQSIPIGTVTFTKQ